jgi:hypothetical protein
MSRRRGHCLPGAGANTLRFTSADPDPARPSPQVKDSPLDSLRPGQTTDPCLGSRGRRFKSGRPDQKVQVRRGSGSHSGPFSIFGSQTGSLDVGQRVSGSHVLGLHSKTRQVAEGNVDDLLSSGSSEHGVHGMIGVWAAAAVRGWASDGRADRLVRYEPGGQVDTSCWRATVPAAEQLLCEGLNCPQA